jgi:hypothetical protein
MLWKFIHKYCSLAGFGMDVKTCVQCGIDIRYNRADVMSAIDDKYYLNTNSGALVCKKCASLKNDTNHHINATLVNAIIDTDADYCISGSVIRFMDGIDNDLPQYPSGSDRVRITELLLSYCRCHFDIRGQFNSAEFMRSM